MLGLNHYNFIYYFAGLEFIYAQSPDSMKGLLIGLFYFIFGAFNAVGTGLFWKLSATKSSSSSEHYANPWFYYATLMICAVGLVLYMVVAYRYKNRQRPTNDESEKEILHRSYATSVYLSHGT